MRKILIALFLALIINPQFALGAVADVTIPNPTMDSNINNWSYTGTVGAAWQAGGAITTTGHCWFGIGSGTTYMETSLLSGVNLGTATFTIYAKYYSTDLTYPLVAYIAWYDSGSSLIGTRTYGDAVTGISYVQLTVTDVTPSNAVYVRFGVFSMSNLNTGHIDDAAINGSAFISEFNLLTPALIVFSMFVTLTLVVRKKQK